ncbi:MAG: metallophosphoesterase [Deltaproteobacteria bacterium]|jgi:predicted MPP superfamily phosphohydrolase|nr:metallophosphoesterase [Deltaproteobacteria bacterium]
MFTVFRVITFLVLLFLAQIVGWRVWRRRFNHPVYRLSVTIVFILFNIGWLVTLYEWRNKSDFGGNFLAWVARPAIAWQTLHALIILPVLALASVLARLGLFLREKLSKAPQPQAPETKQDSETQPPAPLPSLLAPPDRRQFLKTAANVGFFSLIGLCSYAVFRQYRSPEIKRLTLEVANLPKSLEGFTIAQLSDIHIGLWSTEKELDSAMLAARVEKPDLVVLTGDLVDRDPDMAALYGPPLQRHLSDVPYGVWGILGNHDHFTDPARIARILRLVGVKMLIDQRHNFPDLPLSLVGLDDRRRNFIAARNPHSDPDLLVLDPLTGPPVRAEDFKILLNHRPEGVNQAMRAGFNLYLAGHTHGGQYSWPGSDHQLNLATFFYKYTAGLYPLESGWLNVSCGLAAVGVPFRLITWPEISLITLKRPAQIS